MNKQHTLLMLGLLFAWSGCKKDDQNDPGVDVPTPSIEVDMASSFGDVEFHAISGVVMGDSGPVQGATVKCGLGSESTSTDANGFFTLSACESLERYGFVEVEADGYFNGYRQFHPASEGQVVLNIELLPLGATFEVSAVTGGTIDGENWSVTFAPNGFHVDGLPYTGEVEVHTAVLMPSDHNLFNAIPGGLAGANEEGIQLLKTFGMLGVELHTPGGIEVELLYPAQARLEVDDTQLNGEDGSVDLWHLNPENGLWLQEGQAQRVDNEWVMSLPHFSWWNVDVPSSFVFMDGELSRQSSPIGNAHITIATEGAGFGTVWTNAQGAFTGMVPKDEPLQIVALECLDTGEGLTIASAALPAQSESFALPLEADHEFIRFVTGNLIDCDSQAVSLGYLMVDDAFKSIDAQGQFSFQSCAESLELRAYHLEPSVGIYGSDTLVFDFQAMEQDVALVDLKVCNEVYTADDSVSTVSDGEYEYQTVIIGTNEWFAENLKTTHYANGDPIASYSSADNWSTLETGQYVHYNFDEENLDAFGRLYNGFSVVDPRGLCPTGWHVSTTDEWEELGFIATALGLSVGDFLKASAEDVPPWDGYNPSGFDALPGGRVSSEADMNLLGTYGYFWSKNPTNGALSYQLLSTASGEVGVGYFGDSNGYSIRCVRD